MEREDNLSPAGKFNMTIDDICRKSYVLQISCNQYTYYKRGGTNLDH